MYNNDIAHHMNQARRVIARLTEHNFESLIPEEYHRDLIEFSRSIAQKALARFSQRDLKRLSDRPAFEVGKIRDILRVTDPILMASSDYLSDDTTITELWCFATDTYEHRSVVPINKTEEGDFVVFSLGKSDGPVSCTKCKKAAWLIYVSVEEHDAMPYKKGESGGLRYVMRNGIGEGRCKKHQPKPTDQKLSA